MGEIDPEALLPNEHVRNAVREGEVTQLSRGATTRYAETGDTFELDGEAFEIVAVEERTLGELTDADARREGSADLEAYRERMVAVHPGDFEWDEESAIVSYRFERR
ncbi:ASCH domain-containing protein [Halalkalicoccus jeotgali]|uniref:ASCH domain-containing protein n=1 Tax=Halalkalicoccus jeotgali (strain DSM 18796 / CECT 7217 / JCM 14584 / KCTC 4019 / B3) TaxID=795797 RepID=D8J7N2_HALJB|nr:hypothetical protein [Halalkalicoccus jeotgali]ADJ16052.1 hypothetical protein HacjB3_13355 [Halalkalicoccus jeotgali B3]ELY38148.1 hypothetical protein C497_08559 [Halalkalicoccus jeotgali B3]